MLEDRFTAMSNSVFHFKQFAIHQDKCAMKVGTDGVLLGAWATANLPGGGASSVLDVGTGTGLIALMIAQRNSQAVIDAIDIDGDACRQAVENIKQSPFKDRISVVKQSFFDFSPAKTYDLILSNPPFFKNSLHCPDPKRTAARHEDSLPLKQLLEHAIPKLAKDGRIALILPSFLSDELDFIIATHHLFLKRRTAVVTVEGAKPKRLLVEITTSASHQQAFTPYPLHTSCSLTLATKDHHRTAQYLELTKDFYLNF